MKHRVLICLGSNLSDRDHRVLTAAEYFEHEHLDRTDRTPIAVSDDFTGLGRPYANMLLSAETDRSLAQLIDAATRYELAEGRTRHSKHLGVMPIDIDIVFYDGQLLKPRQFDRSYFQRLYKQLNA